MNQFAAVVERLRPAPMGSPQPLSKWVDIRLPTTDTEHAALLDWAQSTPIQPAPPATQEQLARHLQFMSATLPSKALDETAGKMRLTVYSSLLGAYSNEALAFMARKACQTLDWFPTPRQCLDLIADYRPPVSDQETALRLCQDYTVSKFDRWFENVSAGQPIGDVPAQWIRIAVERGILRRLEDGSHVCRSLYQGPRFPALKGAA